MRRVLPILIAVVFGVIAPNAMGEIRATAQVDKQQVAVGEPITYEIRVDGVRNAEVPELAEITGARTAYIGGSDQSVSSVMIINGQRQETRRESFVMQWRVTPTREGTLRIPVQDVVAGGQALKTRAVIVRVGAAQQTGDMTLSVRAGKNKVYVGEAVEVVILWRCMLSPRTAEFALLGDAGGALRWFDAPTSRNGERVELDLLGERVEAAQRVVRVGDGQVVEFEIRRFVVPTRSGEVVIGPLSVRSDLVVRRSRGFLDRDQTRKAGAVSEAVTLDVRALPGAGRPSGPGTVLVGKYEVSARASQTRVRMGDPLTLTVRVKGAMAGRVGTFALGDFEGFDGGFRVSDEVERRELDDGSLELVYTLRVTSGDVTEIPAVELVCFDTQTERYRVVRSEAIRLDVEETRVVTAADGFGGVQATSGSEIEDAGGGLMHNYAVDEVVRDTGFGLGDVVRSPVWLGAAGAPPAVFAGALLLVGARRVREKRGEKKANGKRAMGDARRAIARADDAEGIAAGVRGYMRDRFGVGGEATADAIERAVGGEAGGGLIGVLGRCDAARFGGGEASDIAQLKTEAVGALETIERSHKLGGRA